MDRKSIFKRILGFVLAFSMVLSVLLPGLPAEASKLDQESNLSEDYPLIDRFIKSQTDFERVEESKRYIIEFDEGKKDEGLESIEKIEGLEVKYDYDLVFEGVSVEVPLDKVQELRDTPGVHSISENNQLSPQKFDEDSLAQTIKQIEEDKQGQVANLSKENDGRGTVVAIIDSGLDISHPSMRIDEDARGSLKITDIKEGFTEKVPHGYNYLGGNYDLLERLLDGHGMHIAGIIGGNSEDFKGMAPNCQIFMYRMFTDKTYTTYDRQKKQIVYDYGQFEYGGDDAVYHAIEDAVKNGADVISMSIGQEGAGFESDIYSRAIKNATDAGVVVVTAMGNYSSSTAANTFDKNPANENDLTDTSAMTYFAAIGESLSVGSATGTHISLKQVKIADENFAYAPLGLAEFTEKNFQKQRGNNESLRADFIYTGHARKSEIDKLGQGALRDKIVIAKRGGGSIYDKMDSAINGGAKGFILINGPIDDGRDQFMEVPEVFYESNRTMTDKVKGSDIFAICLSGHDGAKLLDMIGKEPSQDIKILDDKISHKLYDSPRLSSFTGWGPNAELELKPDLVAYGDRIYSTTNRGKFGHMSGTSMSTPQVAGMSAVLKSKVDGIRANNPSFSNYKPFEINKLVLMSTAKPLFDPDQNMEMEYSPRRQGAGLVDLDKALKTQALLESNGKGVVELKEIGSSNLNFDINIHNLSEKDMEFDIETSQVLGEETHIIDKLDMSDGNISVVDFKDEYKYEKVRETKSKQIEGAKLSALKSVKVPANSKVKLTFMLNTGKASKEFVEGYIYFKSKDANQADLSIPYFGYRGDWSESRIIDLPMWEKDSIFKLTALTNIKESADHKGYDTLVLGRGDDGKVDPQKIEMSTSGMAIINRVTARIAALRDARDLEVAIVDENENLVRILSRSNFYKKILNPQMNSWQAEKYTTANPIFEWNGEVYNPGRGYFEPVEDGQYYFRIRARVTQDGDWEETLLPVRVRTEEPKISYSHSAGEKSMKIQAEEGKGLWFVGASLDGKVLDVQRHSDTLFEIKDLEANELTRSRLRIEAMDYAGNIAPVYELDLNEDFTVSSRASSPGLTDTHPDVEFTNARDFVNGDTKKLTGIFKTPEKYNGILISLGENKVVGRVDETGKNFTMDFAYDNSNFFRPKEINFDIKDHNELNFIIDDWGDDEKIVRSKISDGTIKFYPDGDGDTDEPIQPTPTPIPDPSVPSPGPTDQGNGPLTYIGIDDWEEEQIRKQLGQLSYNWLEIGASSPYVRDGNSPGIYIYEPPRLGFDLESSYEYPINGDNYQMRIQTINPSQDDYTPLSEVTLNHGEWDPELLVKDGSNIVNITVHKKGDPSDVIFSRGLIVKVDRLRPIIELEESSSIFGSNIYTNSGQITLRGNVSDNMGEWRLFVNGDNILSFSEPGLYGYENSKKDFEVDLKVSDGDKISLKAETGFGPDGSENYYIVMDTKEPELHLGLIGSEEDLANAKIEVKAIDDKGLYGNPKVYVNGKEYQEGDLLSKYGEDKFFITATAIDRAGNLAYKELNYGGASDGKIQSLVDDIKLKKENYLPEELQSIEDLFDLPEGLNVEIERIDASEPGEKTIKASFEYAGQKLDKTFTINIIPPIKASLKGLSFTEKDLEDLGNVVDAEGFKLDYVDRPDLEREGSQTIKVKVSDDYGNSEIFEFTIDVKKDSTSEKLPKPSEEKDPEDEKDQGGNGGKDQGDDKDKIDKNKGKEDKSDNKKEGPVVPQPKPEEGKDKKDPTEDNQNDEKPINDLSEFKKLSKRVSGKDRVETAIEISKEIFKKADTLVIATGTSFPDALAAQTLARQVDGPLLLSINNKSMEKVREEIQRLGASKIILVGGKNSISTEEESFYSQFARVERIAGADRYQTARLIAEKILAENPNQKEYVIVDGRSYPDALSIGGYAGENYIPILLANGQNLNIYNSLIKGSNLEKAFVVGGEKSVPQSVIKGLYKYERIAGKDRYETSALVAKKFYQEAGKIGLASGQDYPDALTSGIWSSKNSCPVLLVKQDIMPNQAKELIIKKQPREIKIFGGEKSISEDIFK